MNPHVLNVRNVDHALLEGLMWLARAGIENDSRNGKVLVAPGPVLTVYKNPLERVLTSPLRDANPFFHLYECVWMLGGSNDATQVTQFAKNMESFADDQGQMWGAYGWRWREYFGFDQLTSLVELLRGDPKTRRAVLTMWAPVGDLVPTFGRGGLFSKDVPCNTHVYFDATKGELEMTVCNRSNDAVWGAYGANAVHMSFLQEVIAAAIGMPAGNYCQMSNNFHAYVERPDTQRLVSKGDQVYSVHYNPEYDYDRDAMRPTPLGGRDFNYEAFLEDCSTACHVPYGKNSYSQAFFTDVFAPMMTAHFYYKQGDYDTAFVNMGLVGAADWQKAGVEWLHRRLKAAVDKLGAKNA